MIDNNDNQVQLQQQVQSVNSIIVKPQEQQQSNQSIDSTVILKDQDTVTQPSDTKANNNNSKKKKKRKQQQQQQQQQTNNNTDIKSDNSQMINRFGSLGNDDDLTVDEDMTLRDQSKKKKKKTKSNTNQQQQQVLNLTKNNNDDIFDTIYGKDAKVEIEIIKQKRNSGCSVRDLQQYLLWLLSDFQVQLPPWIFTRNKPLLQKVVLITIPGLNYMMFEKSTLLTGKQWFQSHLPHRILFNVPSSSIMSPPGSSIYTNLFQIKSNVKPNHKNAAQKGPIVPVTSYVMNDEELIENGYPMPNLYTDKEGWVVTSKQGTSNQLIAIDCEMCRTNEGLELTRISIINESKKVLLDEYVKPENEIIDYLTIYSGITCDTLKDIKTTLADIQKKVLELVDTSTIIIGHSLENDFKALRFAHGRVIDTSVLFPTGSTNKFPLRYLTKKYLNRVIQNNGAGGHSSIEDAIAVMDLVKLKVSKGKAFGTKAEKYENLFDKLVQYKKKATLVDTMEEISLHSAPSVSAFKCANDDEMVERMVKQVRGPSDFVCSRLYQLSHYYKSIDQHKPTSKTSTTTTTTTTSQNEQNSTSTLSTTTTNSTMVVEDDKVETTTSTTSTTSTLVSQQELDQPNSIQVEEQQTTVQEEKSTTFNNITPIVVDESIVKELESWGGIPVDQKLYDILDSISEKIKKIWDHMTPNSIMILACGPGPYNDINKFRGVAGKESEYVLSLSGSKEGWLFMGIK